MEPASDDEPEHPAQEDALVPGLGSVV
jgi:hypothetical protein